MKKNKFLTTIAAVCIALIALFTGCNKDGPWNENHGFGHDNDNYISGGHNSGGTTTSLVNLGTASTFAVLGGETVTNVPGNASLITGDLGVSPGSAITGFQPVPINRIQGPGTVTAGLGLVTGTIYAGGAVAAQAHNDAITAYNYLVAQLPVTRTFGEVQQLNGLTLTPGIYKFPTSADLAANGKLYLDFGTDPNALFIFQIGTILVTGLNSQIIAIGGSTTCLGPNVFWAVGSSATIDGDQFIGTVIAYTTITMTNTGNASGTTNVAGRMLALHGEVTMVNSIISTCGTSVGGKHPKKPCRDFVTGGGWINDKATFGVSGGIKNGKFWGQLSFNDHDGTKIKSTEAIGYAYIDATTRQIKYLVKVNGEISADTVTVTVSDEGEPGRDDTFTLTLNDVTTTGTLTGGNIQLHKECGDKKDGHDRDGGEYYQDNDESDGHRNCDNNRGGKYRDGEDHNGGHRN